MNPKPVATDLGISYTRTHTHWLGRFGGSGGGRVKQPSTYHPEPSDFRYLYKIAHSG